MSTIEPQPTPITYTVKIIGHCADKRLAAFMDEMEDIAAQHKDSYDKEETSHGMLGKLLCRKRLSNIS